MIDCGPSVRSEHAPDVAYLGDLRQCGMVVFAIRPLTLSAVRFLGSPQLCFWFKVYDFIHFFGT